MKKTFQFLLCILSFNLSAQAPNFVFILADDMGWNGTSLQISPSVAGSMSDFYETPNLAQLAAEGMTFSQAYSPAPNCSPTRNSILTGEVPARNSFTTVGGGNTTDQILISGTNGNSIDLADITIAEWLNSTNLNYRTAHYGKWHIGSGGPAANGFSHDDGDNNNEVGNADDGQVIQDDPKKLMDLTNKGITFMQDAVAGNEPFYLQLSHYAVHTLVETTQAAQDYFTAKPSGTVHNNIDYAGMTRDFDDAIGVLLAEIENLGISGETYVIFMSDNGAQANQSSNQPLYRSKGSIYEGGIRVPMIVRGPNIPANSTNPEPVVGYDLFPTIADWTGSSATLPSTLDGTSIKNLTLQTTFNRNEPVYFHYPHYGNGNNINPASVAIQGDYKLIINYQTGLDELFNLSENIRDTPANDILATNPTLALEMKIKLRDHLKEVNANMPSLDPTHANFSGTAPDIDSDTLEDEWEFRELLSYHYGPTDDPDGDGMDNLTEMNNGTDPLINETVGIDYVKTNNSSFINIFPNPTQGVLNLEFNASSPMNTMIEAQIFSLNGKLVQTFKAQKSEILSFSLANISNGIYTVKILENGELTATEKVVLTNQK